MNVDYLVLNSLYSYSNPIPIVTHILLTNSIFTGYFIYRLGGIKDVIFDIYLIELEMQVMRMICDIHIFSLRDDTYFFSSFLFSLDKNNTNTT